MYSVVTFYKFVSLDRLPDRQQVLQELCQAHQIKGTILLANEGINATLAGLPDGLNTVLEHIQADASLADLQLKYSTAAEPPFHRMKVKLKPELIPLGMPEIDPSQRVGTYVSPEQWNELLTDPDVVLIDTRNDYEVAIGTFKGAHNPNLQHFRQFPDYARQHLDSHQHKKIAMFCTGGIRCEKASALLLEQGFSEVYHLQGGILSYLETVPPEASTWEGECFVFDERVSVRQGLQPGTYDLCYACGHPISQEDKTSETYEPGVSCPHCIESVG
ncbi:MAG: rhodanese-related sulfurtransferase [Elainellaceae cyanobacterium]